MEFLNTLAIGHYLEYWRLFDHLKITLWQQKLLFNFSNWNPPFSLLVIQWMYFLLRTLVYFYQLSDKYFLSCIIWCTKNNKPMLIGLVEIRAYVVLKCWYNHTSSLSIQIIFKNYTSITNTTSNITYSLYFNNTIFKNYHYLYKHFKSSETSQ